MATVTAPTATSSVSATSGLYFSCNVVLSETEQIIIHKEVTEGSWVNSQYVVITTGETQPYRLEELNYASTDGQVRLSSMTIRGFRKDKGLRFRDSHIYLHDTYPGAKALIDQVPDEYHDKARQAFAENMADLQVCLTTTTNNGVQIGN